MEFNYEFGFLMDFYVWNFYELDSNMEFNIHYKLYGIQIYKTLDLCRLSDS